MPVLMEISRIVVSEINEQQIIFLKEVDGERVFPIVIGIFEALSIQRHIRGEITPRPFTHDLILQLIEQMGGIPHDIIITELHEQTFYAKLRIRREGQLIEIDSRPSDAIAVAVSCKPNLPIYVNEEVLREVLGEN